MKSISNAVLYMSQLSEKSEMIQAKTLVDQCQGIINTMLGQASPKLLLVDYDPAKARIIDVINFLKTKGIVAKVIGL